MTCRGREYPLLFSTDSVKQSLSLRTTPKQHAEMNLCMLNSFRKMDLKGDVEGSFGATHLFSSYLRIFDRVYHIDFELGGGHPESSLQWLTLALPCCSGCASMSYCDWTRLSTCSKSLQSRFIFPSGTYIIRLLFPSLELRFLMMYGFVVCTSISILTSK